MIVAGGQLVRLHADGTADASFGVDGVAEDSRLKRYQAVTLQADGKILAAGGACFDNPKGGGFGCIANLARYESDRTQLCGDADGSGAISVSDGVATLRAAAGLDSVCSPLVCDVDGSGSVAVTDGVNVLRAAAGLPATLSCGIP